MPDYFNGKIRPEPGRPAKVSQPVINVQPNVDTNAIADAVIKAIEKKLETSGKIVVKNKEKIEDNFDDSSSMEKLADVMTMSREGESNFGDLGSIKKVQKDISDTNKTIDLLKDVE